MNLPVCYTTQDPVFLRNKKILMGVIGRENRKLSNKTSSLDTDSRTPGVGDYNLMGFSNIYKASGSSFSFNKAQLLS